MILTSFTQLPKHGQMKRMTGSIAVDFSIFHCRGHTATVKWCGLLSRALLLRPFLLLCSPLIDSMLRSALLISCASVNPRGGSICDDDGTFRLKHCGSVSECNAFLGNLIDSSFNNYNKLND